MNPAAAEAGLTLDRLQAELEDLAVGGLRAAGRDRLAVLRDLHADLSGAPEVARRLESLVAAVDSGTRDAAPALVRTQAALRMVERLLTVEEAAARLLALAPKGGGAPPLRARAGAALPPAAEQAGLRKLLGDVQAAVEDLLLTGLAAASGSTRRTLQVSFEAASRLRLSRLGLALRVATDETARFTRNDPAFSRRRFLFFLNRAWMMAHGLRLALDRGDALHWQKLTSAGALRPVPACEVVSLGVGRRVAASSVAFEFRLRSVGGDLPAGTPLSWSTVFPLRPEADIPPDAYLHLPQPQGFKAAALLPGGRLRLIGIQVSEDGRLALGKDTRVEPGPAWTDWDALLAADPGAARARLQAHEPGPFDLDVELMEEVVIRDFRALPAETDPREHVLRHPVESGQGLFHVVTGTGPEDAPLVGALQRWRSPQAGPLFGLVHYERRRFVLQPLTLFGPEGPEAVVIQKDAYDPAKLVRTLKFT